MADEKKIIIDEDWKSQVQAEKEAAAGKAESSASPAASDQQAAAPPGDGSDPVFPPASLEMLITTLATEALVAMGQVPNPGTGKAELRRNQAKYLIDTLEVLQQKTKTHVTPAEQQLIDSVLHQLRMLFVATATETVVDK